MSKDIGTYLHRPISLKEEDLLRCVTSTLAENDRRGRKEPSFDSGSSRLLNNTRYDAIVLYRLIYASQGELEDHRGVDAIGSDDDVIVQKPTTMAKKYVWLNQ